MIHQIWKKSQKYCTVFKLFLSSVIRYFHQTHTWKSWCVNRDSVPKNQELFLQHNRQWEWSGHVHLNPVLNCNITSLTCISYIYYYKKTNILSIFETTHLRHSITSVHSKTNDLWRVTTYTKFLEHWQVFIHDIICRYISSFERKINLGAICVSPTCNESYCFKITLQYFC